MPVGAHRGTADGRRGGTGYAAGARLGDYRARLDAAGLWIAIDVAPGTELDDGAKAMAVRTGRPVVAWGSDSAIDGFRYVHVGSDGAVVRLLDYGMIGDERAWNVLDGPPEAWEDGVFFSDEERAAQLDDADDDDRAEIESIYAARALRKGSMYPFLGGLGTMLIPQALGLPGLITEPAGGWAKEARRAPPPGLWARVAGWFGR